MSHCPTSVGPFLRMASTTMTSDSESPASLARVQYRIDKKRFRLWTSLRCGANVRRSGPRAGAEIQSGVGAHAAAAVAVVGELPRRRKSACSVRSLRWVVCAQAGWAPPAPLRETAADSQGTLRAMFDARSE